MNATLHKSFLKKYIKLRPGEKQKFKERRDLFLNDPFNPILNNHALEGKYKGYRSINIGGDLRVVYKVVADDIALLVTIDTHSNLYK